MAHKRTLWKKHGSVLFIGGEVVITAVLITLSISLHGKEPYASIVSHLAAMFLAAVVATVFFALHDVRETIAASISALLLDGEAVSHLSDAARRALAKRIMLEEVGCDGAALPDSLYDHARDVERHLFAVPHFINYTPTVILADIEDQPELLQHDYRCTYTVSAKHLPDARCMFAFRFRHEISDPTGKIGDAAVKRFEARVGDIRFTLDDLKVSKRKSGGLDVTLLSLDRDVQVTGEVPVTISYDGITSRSDPTEIFYSWFPTKGFRVTLLYSNAVAYDCAWFKAWTSVVKDFPGREQVVLMPNGITAYTDEWLLPGHGVVLYWFKRVVPSPLVAGEIHAPR